MTDNGQVQWEECPHWYWRPHTIYRGWVLHEHHPGISSHPGIWYCGYPVESTEVTRRELAGRYGLNTGGHDECLLEDGRWVHACLDLGARLDSVLSLIQWIEQDALVQMREAFRE